MPKKSKLESLHQAHGKVENFKPTSLDQLWGGYDKMSLYGTLDENEYKARITQFTRADLENHARTKGCIVVEDSGRLREALLKQFRAYVLSLKKPDTASAKIKISPAAEKVLLEGR